MRADKSQLEALPGVWLDTRRALFLERESILCLADVHFGYEWAHRHAGQLLPVPPDETAARIEKLCAAYGANRLALLGDIIHRDVPGTQARAAFRDFLSRISACSNVVLIVGNHDKGLERLLSGEVPIHDFLCAGEYLLVHGDSLVEHSGARVVISGHEHPAVGLGDGVRGARFPCFLIGEHNLVLPAFSNWAAGCDIRSGQFMSPLARNATFTHAVAIMGDKLLRLPVN